MRNVCAFVGCAAVALIPLSASGHTLQVGPGQTYGRIDSAYAAAAAGDTIMVWPLANDSAYHQTAVLVKKANLHFVGQGSTQVRLDGRGYDYTGAGSVPRAAFQFDPGSDGCTVENFEVYDDTNDSYNGAAFRINQSNNVTIRNCDIHNNDMGIMSNGVLTAGSGANQLIENCSIHTNGNAGDPGYNHNLYLGGTSVTVRGCDIHDATTGHNVKSRAHVTIVEGCYVHDSPNREFDLVDEATNTTAPGSDALISGCIVKKLDNSQGNKTTIHFGQDGGNAHRGRLCVLHCTILTSYMSPVVDLSDTNASVRFYDCLVVDPSGAQSNMTLVGATRGGASLDSAGGQDLWIAHGFGTLTYGSFARVTVGAAGVIPAFVNTAAVDYRPATVLVGVVDAGTVVVDASLPVSLQGRTLLTFAPPLGSIPRTFVGAPDIGACEFGASTVVPAVARSHAGLGPSTAPGFAVDVAGRALRTTAVPAAGMAPCIAGVGIDMANGRVVVERR